MKRFFKKHLIPIIVLIIVIGILCVIFTSFTGSGETVAWWIIGIVGSILIGIAILKFKGNTPLSGLSLPSFKTLKSIGAVAALIVIGIFGWRWLNRPEKKPDVLITQCCAVVPKAYHPMIGIGQNHLLKDSVYRFSRKCKMLYYFNTKNKGTKVTLRFMFEADTTKSFIGEAYASTFNLKQGSDPFLDGDYLIRPNKSIDIVIQEVRAN